MRRRLATAGLVLALGGCAGVFGLEPLVYETADAGPLPPPNDPDAGAPGDEFHDRARWTTAIFPGDFYSAAFDGRHAYFIERKGGTATALHRLDTLDEDGFASGRAFSVYPLSAEPFSDLSVDQTSVYVFQGGNPGLQGVVLRFDFGASPFDGKGGFRTVVLAPGGSNRFGWAASLPNGAFVAQEIQPGGAYLQYDGAQAFDDAGSWPARAGTESCMLTGAACFDSRVYFSGVSGERGCVVSHDWHRPLVEDWDVRDAPEANWAQGLGRPIPTDRFVYFGQPPNAVVDGGPSIARRGPTGQDWETHPLDPGAIYVDGAFDGRWVYFAPRDTGGPISYARYDTRAPFADRSSWQYASAPDVGVQAAGRRPTHSRALFDGKYVYFVPAEGGMFVRYRASDERVPIPATCK